jgi:hypothetical protein
MKEITKYQIRNTNDEDNAEAEEPEKKDRRKVQG